MNRLSIIIPAAALLFATVLSTPAAAQYRRGRTARPAGRVIINGKTLSRAVRAALARRGLRITAGRYWYDRRSGAWGYAGGPIRGVIAAGLRGAGRLKANASRGRSGVYVNGRQLTWAEAIYMRRLVRYMPRGRYWVDRWGNAGRVGGPALVNLRRLAARSGARAGARSGARSGARGLRGNWLVHRPGTGGRTGIGVAGDGKTTCVSTAGYTRCN